MSLKKTWFSYVLWFVLAGLTGLTSYIAIVKVFALLPWVSALLVAGIIGLCVLSHFICGKIKGITLSKWPGRIVHTLIFLLITAAFVILRLPVLMNGQVAVSSQQATWFYEASKVGRDVLGVAGMTSFFEQVYLNVLSGMFLLLGNKIELLLYVQVVLQILSFVLLIFIGWNMQKGIYAWIPAFFYAISPFMYSSLEEFGPANFWTGAVLLCLFVICLLQNTWKRGNVTYIVMVLWQILFVAIYFVVKIDVLWYGNPTFSTGGYLKGTESFLGMEMLVAVVALIGYCVSFWFHKQDHRTLYIIPFVLDCVILTMAAFSEPETCCLFMMLAAINLYFLTAENLRVTLHLKAETLTGRMMTEKSGKEAVKEEDKPDAFDWEEMKTVMKSSPEIEEESVSVKMEEMKETVPVIDRRAPIENVLPMPKKHVPKVLDYAFEPAEDMMHYDVEIENDDYDY